MVAGPKLADFESWRDVFRQFQRLPSISDCLDESCPPRVVFVTSFPACKKNVSVYYYIRIVEDSEFLKRRLCASCQDQIFLHLLLLANFGSCSWPDRRIAGTEIYKNIGIMCIELLMSLTTRTGNICVFNI